MENISGTVNKAIDILEAFIEKDAELGLTELARITGYNNATVYRLLSTMASRGLVHQGQKKGKYSLGLKTLEYSLVVRMHLNYLDITYLHLSKLCRDHNIAVNLTVHDSDSEIIVDEIGVVNDFRLTAPIGKRLPLHATANGKVALAYMPDEERSAYFQKNELKPITKYTITDPARLKKELNDFKKEGLAFDNEEFILGTRAVAAPVFNNKGQILCIAVAVLPAAAYDPARTCEIGEPLKNCTREISIITSRIM